MSHETVLRDLHDSLQDSLCGWEAGEVRIEGGEAVVELRIKLEPWQVHDMPMPRQHGPLTQHDTMMCDMLHRIDMNLHRTEVSDFQFWGIQQLARAADKP